MLYALIIIALSFVFLFFRTSDPLFAAFFAILVPLPIILIAWCFIIGIVNEKDGKPNHRIDELLGAEKK